MSDFLPQALAGIRKRCNEFDPDNDGDHLVHLAALFYAVAAKLPSEVGSAGLDEIGLRPEAESVTEILQHLARLSTSTSAPALFQALGKTLQLIEEDLEGKESSWRSLPRETDLSSFAEFGLSGQVVHWLRRSTAFNEERHARRLIFEKQSEETAENPSPAAPDFPSVGTPHPSDFLRRLAMHWNSDSRPPRLVVADVVDRGAPLIETSGSEVRSDSFRIALCPLDPRCHPLFQLSSDGRTFCASGRDSLENTELLETHLESLVRAAASHRIHLLVLPELMVSETGRTKLISLFRHYRKPQLGRLEATPWGVVAGSFHVWRNGEEPGSHPPANESCLFGTRAEPFLRHEKRGKFRLSRRQYKAAYRAGWFPGCLKELPRVVCEVVEGIHHGGEISVLDTQLGRLALAICADCIAPDWTNLEQNLIGLEPDLLFVVSMTPETKVFWTFMERLAKRGIGVFFVNAHCICPTDSSEILAAAHLPFWEPEGAPPTRIRWRASKDGGVGEVRYFWPAGLSSEASAREKKRRRNWRTLQQAVEDFGELTGVSWLEDGGQRLALVVDLGAHWAWTRRHLAALDDDEA